MPKLSACLREAESYWQSQSPSSAPIMTIMATRCVDILGADRQAASLSVADGRKILETLSKQDLSRKYIGNCYSTFKRILKLNDAEPHGLTRWPQPPKPPRKVRSPVTAQEFGIMAAWLVQKGYTETRDLAILLNGLGGRVQRELLTPGGCRYRTRGGVLFVLITGKGSHEREVPIGCKNARAILQDRSRYNAVLAVPYKTHLWRWNNGKAELGLEGLATFHGIRHKYATEVFGKTQNLRLVQELLGHSNPATTAIYTHVGMDDKVRALTSE